MADTMVNNAADGCIDEDASLNMYHSCANDPDFAVICAFLEKFSKDLSLDMPNFKQLQEWLTNTDEVSQHLRSLHIKLLRKTRKTVHEVRWESALSKFCFTYSSQDAWEVERFGYKKSSLKVKLRILRELLESQFERNATFRAKILAHSADSMRSQPIGRDRLGHSYWLTQDSDCNLRIYQEHLDEEIWQVVATNRDEFANLITRLRGNEVVLPSTDIGIIDEDTSSSNSCAAPLQKSPPPVEQDDSQEEAKVPNLCIKLSGSNSSCNVKTTPNDIVPLVDVGKGEEELAAEEDAKLLKKKSEKAQKPTLQQPVDKVNDVDDDDEEEEEEEEEAENESENGEEEESDAEDEYDDSETDEIGNQEIKTSVAITQSKPIIAPEKLKLKLIDESQKKVQPIFISQSKIAASSPTHSSKKRTLDEVDKSSPTREESSLLKKQRPSLLDSKREKKPSKYENAKSDDDNTDTDNSDDGEEGEEEDIDSAAAEEDENEQKEIEEDSDSDDEPDQYQEVGKPIEDPKILVRGQGAGKDCEGGNEIHFLQNFADDFDALEIGDAIEEETLYITDIGQGLDCLVGNTKNEAETEASEAVTPTSNEPKATFFFGQPGCLKLSPMKQTPEQANNKDGTCDDEQQKTEVIDKNCKEIDMVDMKENNSEDIIEKNNVEDQNNKAELDIIEHNKIVDSNKMNINDEEKKIKCSDKTETDDIFKTNGNNINIQQNNQEEKESKVNKQIEVIPNLQNLTEEKIKDVKEITQILEPKNAEVVKAQISKSAENVDSKIEGNDRKTLNETKEIVASKSAEIIETNKESLLNTKELTDEAIKTERNTNEIIENEKFSKDESNLQTQANKPDEILKHPHKNSNDDTADVHSNYKLKNESKTQLNNLTVETVAEQKDDAIQEDDAISEIAETIIEPNIETKPLKAMETNSSTTYIKHKLTEKPLENVVTAENLKIPTTLVATTKEEEQISLIEPPSTVDEKVTITTLDITSVSEEKSTLTIESVHVVEKLEKEKHSINLLKDTAPMIADDSLQTPTTSKETQIVAQTNCLEEVAKYTEEEHIEISTIDTEEEKNSMKTKQSLDQTLKDDTTKSFKGENTSKENPVVAANAASEIVTLPKVDQANPLEIQESLEEKPPQIELEKNVLIKETEKKPIINRKVLKVEDPLKTIEPQKELEKINANAQVAMQKTIQEIPKIPVELKLIEMPTTSKESPNLVKDKLCSSKQAFLVKQSAAATTNILNTSTLPNRKRRLAELAAPPCPRLTSESEVDIHSENPDEAIPEDELEESDIGGKRFKMRAKLTNAEQRKKIEAQKVAVEETTSSSGEEDARRRRKVISPKRQCDTSGEKSAKQVSMPKKEKQESTLKTNEENIDNQLAAEISTKKINFILSTVSTKSMVSAPKQKPTLDEIIEKKLKKTPEKISLTDACSSTSMAMPPFSSPKKLPITKPLKKNLLTQIRLEESDEEAIPRKRNISVSVASVTVDPIEAVDTKPELVSLLTTNEVKATESKLAKPNTSKHKIPERKTPERKTPDRQRKRRSSEETKQNELPEPEDKMECVSEKLKKNNDDEEPIKHLKETPKMLEEKKCEEVDIPKNVEEIKCETLPPKIDVDTLKVEISKEMSPTPQVLGRRSGRRGAATVMYSELPQPKRTRGGAKSTVVAKKEEEITVEKPAEVTTAVVVSEKLKELPKKKPEPSKIVEKKPAAKAKPNKKETPQKKELTAEKNELTPLKVKQESKTVLETKSKDIDSQDNDSKDTENISDKDVTSAKTPTTTNSADSTPTTTGPGRGRGGRKQRDVDTTNIIETIDSETPVRMSRRIAQQKIREEAERRKLEEIALRTMKQELKKKKKAEKEADPTVVEPSEHSSSEEVESEVETKKKSKKKLPGKDGWSSGSEEQDEPEQEEEPPYYDPDPGSPLFRSDHEFSPESDLEDESQVVPMKRARTARKEDAIVGEDNDDEEEACYKCGKSDHPEWILLCDTCDKGYHCSCLSPVLFYIPEGNWYCPPCQQEKLIVALEHQLKEFDELVERKQQEVVEEKRLAELAVRAELERLENELDKKDRKKKNKNKRRNEGEKSGNSSTSSEDDEDGDGKERKVQNNEKSDGETDDDNKSSKKAISSKKDKRDETREKGKRRRGDGRRRRAATRGTRRRRRNGSGSGSGTGSENVSGSDSGSGSDSSSSSATDSDDEPIYKLRKRRQINVSYRLNEYDDLINSALKKEMGEAAVVGNLGRGKDITTIIEADNDVPVLNTNEEKGDAGVETDEDRPKDDADEVKSATAEEQPSLIDVKEQGKADDESDDEPIKRKAKPKIMLKKKPRKLTKLDISSEEDRGSDEDFKTSSFDEEDEDTSISVSSNSDSSLEIYRRRKKGGKKKQRKAARRAARERRKDKKFVVDDSDDDEPLRPKKKKKRKDDSDYTESTGDDDENSELSENMDSADLCDDSTSEGGSDGAWHPSKRKKQRKSHAPMVVARKSPKLKKPQIKKPKRVEYSDDDISESEEEEEEDDGDIGAGGKGSGKQPRSQPLKPNTTSGKGKGKGGGGNKGGGSGSGKGKGKGRASTNKKKKNKSSDEDEESCSDSDDSTRRTRGRRYAYLEDFDDDSSDGGIKPGVQRPDTPPEEREKFIKRQEEIKRMLAEKNAEGAKLAATPRLTPIKGAAAAGDKDKRSPVKAGDSLSTVPLSVIRQAKVLDIDYLTRKGETVGELENVDDVDSEFDDADLPDDFPEDMDEDAIARMVEEEEDFGAAAARELPAPDEVLRTPVKTKTKETEKLLINPSLAALSQMPGASPSGLQEPLRKRLPMPTMHPPLLRHQFPPHAGMPPTHMMQRHSAPPTHLLQNALCAPLGQPIARGFPPHHQHQQHPGAHGQRMPGMPPGLHPPHLMPARQSLPASQRLPGAAPSSETARDSEVKPRGRRKKITPLRDPLQKQQAAAAATAAAHAATTTDSKTPTTASIAVPSSVIKSAGPSSLAIAQPPQLFKPPGGGVAGADAQPSVITRMPHLPPHARPGGPPSGMYPGSDVPRFYGPPPTHQGPHPGAAGRHPPPNTQRHRGPPQMSGMPPHPGMRPTYGPPPPLRGAPPSNHAQPPNTAASGVRSPYATNTQQGGEHHVPPPGLGAVYGGPPPARHASPHLNPYRPHIYGNPNYAPRGPPTSANLRAGAPQPGAEYGGSPRGYPPYGYYPPPPPLNTPTHAQAARPPPTHVTAAPSSVIVAAPPAASAAAPLPPAPAVNHAVSSIITSQPSSKSPIPSRIAAAVAAATMVANKAAVEPRKKLTTLEAYTATPTKSPLAIGGESSGSRSSPGGIQPDGADDSSSTPANSTSAAATTEGGEGQASEFSGLVSYFSSQHDDYNT